MPECSKKRKNILAFVFALGFSVSIGFLFSPQTVSADTWGGGSDPDGNQAGVEAMSNKLPIGGATEAKGENQGSAQGKDDSNVGMGECSAAQWAINFVKCSVIATLNALTSGLAWFASGAAGLFVWVVHPDNMSGPNGILNKGSLYELWKFIRDFFNLFFILILLLSAFATVFQVENFSIRKIFLNILFAALIINFSFPITRALIDLANVPMYYFLNSILPGTDGGKAFVSGFLGSTGMAGIPLASGATIAQALSNTIFMFLFTISLFVLGVTFLIRLVALTLLLVFSPFGFAATLLPGFQQLGRDWWNKFWSYAFYGPAAALMILVAIRFQQEIGRDQTFNELRKVTTEMSAGSPESTSIALIVFYTIPLILIWSAIGMANKFSIAGADKVVGMGYGAARRVGGWAKKGTMKVTGANYVANRAKAYMKEREKRADAKFAATNIGSRLGQKMNAALDKVSASRVGGKLETQASRVARGAAMERYKGRVSAAQKEHMVSSLTDKDLVKLHNDNKAGRARTKDKDALHAATTQEVAKRKIGSTLGVTQASAAADMQLVKKNFGQMAGAKNEVTEDTKKEVAQAYGEAAFRNEKGDLVEGDFREAIREGQIDAAKVSSVAITKDFVRLMALEGKLNQQMIKTIKDNNPAMDLKPVFDGALSDMSTSVGPRRPHEQAAFDKASTELHKDYVYANGEFHASATDDDKNNVMKKSDYETFLKMAEKDAGRAEGEEKQFDNIAVRLVEHGGPSKAVSILAKMAEEGRDISRAVENIRQNDSVFSQRAFTNMKKDYRFAGYTNVSTSGGSQASRAGQNSGPTADQMNLETPEEAEARVRST